MVRISLPFLGKGNQKNGLGDWQNEPLRSHDETNCPVLANVSSELREAAAESQALSEYLHKALEEHEGVPEYVGKMSRKFKDVDSPNVIYPIGGGLFVHVYPNPAGKGRAHYVSIEPGMTRDLGRLLEVVDERLQGIVAVMGAATLPDQNKESLLRALDQVVVFEDGQGTSGESRADAVPINVELYQALRYLMVRDKVEQGTIQPLIHDTNIEDISCSGLGPIFLEHKIFDSVESNIGFETMEELDGFVVQMSEKIGRPVTRRDPVADAALLDGSRVNIVYGGEVSKRGSNFSIRKVAEEPLSILTLIEFDSITYEMAAYLSLALGHGMNIFVCGETASGKTTLINALTTFIKPTARIVSIEDTPELQVPHPNWARELVRGSVTMMDLLMTSLRQRPDEILIGEIRGAEGNVAFQAMQTGHALMSTFHASSVEKLIQRLSGEPINIPLSYIDNINVVVIQSAVQLPNGKPGRRCTSISEIVGYDPKDRSFSFQEAFVWDPTTDDFNFVGDRNSYMMENRIAPLRGLSTRNSQEIYNVIEKRAQILKKLHQQGVTDFDDLYVVLAKAQDDGTF